jgi:hypothetical protein
LKQASVSVIASFIERNHPVIAAARTAHLTGESFHYVQIYIQIGHPHPIFYFLFSYPEAKILLSVLQSSPAVKNSFAMLFGLALLQPENRREKT